MGSGICSGSRDYDTSSCPPGWIENAGICERAGPASPNPKCGSRYAFMSMSVEDRQSIAKVCGIEWPCLNECRRDYRALCPQGWSTDLLREVCTAPASYAGDCKYETLVKGWHREEKETFAAACGAPYPCSSSEFNIAEKEAEIIKDGPVDGSGRIVAGQ